MFSLRPLTANVNQRRPFTANVGYLSRILNTAAIIYKHS